MPREALVLGLAHKHSFRIRQPVPEDFAYLAAALTGWLVVLIVRILGVLKSGGITTVLKNQYYTNGNIEFTIRTIRAALDVTSSFVTYKTLFSSTLSAIS
jgi:hypothetical protein